MCQPGRVQSGLCLPSRFGSNFRIMIESSSGPGIAFKAFLVSARVWVPLSNKIRVQVGSVQHIYGLFGFGYKYLDPWRPLLQILQIHSSMLVGLLFSSSHSFSTGFRSEDWNGHSRNLVLCSVTHLCVVSHLLIFLSVGIWYNPWCHASK